VSSTFAFTSAYRHICKQWVNAYHYSFNYYRWWRLAAGRQQAGIELQSAKVGQLVRWHNPSVLSLPQLSACPVKCPELDTLP
jgi:hypothetical protein